MKHSHIRLIILLVVVLPILSLLSGCSENTSSGNSLKMASMSGMPSEIQKAPVTVSDAYRFAVANPDALKNVPCYCGCGAVGHTSNYSCFVQGVKSSGDIVFDQHALGCSLCVDIAQNVMHLTQDGKTPQEIRAQINQTFSQYGPSNMVPVK